MELNSILEQLYATDTQVPAIEKTAEANLLSQLSGNGQVVENPYESLSLEELTKLASELGEEAVEEDETPDEIEKIAFEKLGGEVMAHALVHEFGLMKTAMSQGLCRVCKENHFDVEGSTICSACS